MPKEKHRKSSGSWSSCLCTHGCHKGKSEKPIHLEVRKWASWQRAEFDSAINSMCKWGQFNQSLPCLTILCSVNTSIFCLPSFETLFCHWTCAPPPPNAIQWEKKTSWPFNFFLQDTIKHLCPVGFPTDLQPNSIVVYLWSKSHLIQWGLVLGNHTKSWHFRCLLHILYLCGVPVAVPRVLHATDHEGGRAWLMLTKSQHESLIEAFESVWTDYMTKQLQYMCTP